MENGNDMNSRIDSIKGEFSSEDVNEIYASAGFREYVLKQKLSERGFNSLSEKRKDLYLRNYITDNIGELENLSNEDRKKYLSTDRNMPDNENLAVMTMSYLQSFDKNILKEHPEILRSKTMADAIAGDKLGYDQGDSYLYAPQMRLVNNLYLAKKDGIIDDEQFQAATSLRSPETGETLMTGMLKDLAEDCNKLVENKDPEKVRTLLNNIKGHLDGRIDTASEMFNMNVSNSAGEFPLDILRSIDRSQLEKMTGGEETISILNSLESRIERKTAPGNIAKLANKRNVEERALSTTPSEMDITLYKIEDLQKNGGSKEEIAKLQAQGRKILAGESKTCDLEQKTKNYLGDDVYAIKDYLTDTNGFKNFLNGKEPESVTERNVLLKKYIKENPDVLKQADLHFQENPQKWLKLKAKAEKEYNDEAERNALLGVKDEKHLETLLVEDKKKYKDELYVNDQDELSVSDSDKSNKEELSVDDHEAKDAPAAQQEDKKLKSTTVKRRDGLDHPEEEDEDKGPFKEGDIIDYMYNEWMIALANHLYKKAAKKVKSWGTSAYISFLQGLEDRRNKEVKERKEKKPKTTTTLDYYRNVERKMTKIVERRINAMNQNCDKLIGAYQKLAEGDFSVLDNLPDLQKEHTLKSFNEIKNGQVPKEFLEKMSPTEREAFDKKVKENENNPLKAYCQYKIGELEQTKTNFKAVCEIAGNYVCSKLGDAAIVDKNFNPNIEGLEEQYHLMAVKSLLANLDDINAYNKDPQNKDDQKDPVVHLQELSKESAKAKKHTDRQIDRNLVDEHKIKQPYDKNTVDEKGKPGAKDENGNSIIPLAKNTARSELEESLRNGRTTEGREDQPKTLYEAFSRNVITDEKIAENISYLELGEERLKILEEERRRRRERTGGSNEEETSRGQGHQNTSSPVTRPNGQER